jgi:hypothetical protein
MAQSTIESVDDCVVYLVPLGRNRYELYSEPPDEEDAAPAPHDGFFHTRIERLRQGWRSLVQSARRGAATDSRLARWRDWAVSRIAESIAEQRTLWSLRSMEAADLRYSSDLTEAAATEQCRGLLAHARRHHGMWLILDGLLFAGSGVLALVPGPNVLAYYFGLRAVGHLLSWRGARQGLDRITWRQCPEPALAELAALASEPRDARAPRVEAIATHLNLPRLAAFFDRAAVPG